MATTLAHIVARTVAPQRRRTQLPRRSPTRPRLAPPPRAHPHPRPRRPRARPDGHTDPPLPRPRRPRRGDVNQLTESLRVAFSVTVVGLLVGAIAFGISLVRDRLYAQDHSDLEYVAANLTRPPQRRASARYPTLAVTTKVTPRARRRDDRAGDPLDGLVNLFDLGIVLALAFLLAALASLENRDRRSAERLRPNDIVVRPDQQPRNLPPARGRVVGQGKKIGNVYRLEDGRLIYVTRKPR